LSRGAHIDAISNDGRTALMWAIIAHKHATVEALALAGADPTIIDLPVKGAPPVPGKNPDLGQTALDYAEAKHSRDPVLRHISKYMGEWMKQREDKSSPLEAPQMPLLPWVVHAKEFTAAHEKEQAATGAATESSPAAPHTDADDIWDENEAETVVQAEVPQQHARKVKFDLATEGEDLDELD